jgi:hypothetical protein
MALQSSILLKARGEIISQKLIPDAALLRG